MRHGWLLRGELQRLAASRRERGEPIDWAKWSHAAAATLDAIRPGRDRIVMMASGRPYAGRYYQTWAECAPQNLFCEGKNRLALTLDEVPDDILRVAEAACRAAGKRRHRTFLKGETIGRLLGVTAAERDRLALRIIGAIDAPKSELKETAMERKRERDRTRIRDKRRKQGAKPRSESIAEQARQMGISPSALRVRLHRQRLQCNGFVASTESVPCNGFVASTETTEGIEKTAISSVDSAHVTVSSPHIYEVSSLVTSAQPSEEPQDRTSENVVGATAARRDRRTPSSAIIPPPKPAAIDGYAPEVFYFISLSAHEAATQIRRVADFRNPESVTAAITSVIRAEDRAFIRAMETNGLDTDGAWLARGYLDRRICQIVQADRADAR